MRVAAPKNPFMKWRDGPRYMYLEFDLALSIEEQLHAAGRFLEGQQAHREKKGVITRIGKDKRNQKEKYRAYLRLLDADLSGASHNEMALGIFGERIETRDDKVRQRVRDNLEAARLMRDHDFRYITLKKAKK